MTAPHEPLASPFRVTVLGRIRHPLAVASAIVVLGALPARADTFTNGGGDNQYTNPANWSGNVVPATNSGATATIANGSAVQYTPGGDLIINGGTLEVSNGSFTQVVGDNYIQLGQNGTGGTVLVDGGTFNQGTDSATPFNLSGSTGNSFTITSGSVNLSTSFNMNPGLTFMQSGGTLTITNGEADFNSNQNTLSGGIFNTSEITGVNGATANPDGTNNHVFNISGGILNLTGAKDNGIYGGGATQYINFTLSSTGSITFTSGSETTGEVQGFLNGGVIEYNSTTNPNAFTITQNGNNITLTLAPGFAGVPEPSSVLLTLLGVAGLAGWMVRRRREVSVA